MTQDTTVSAVARHVGGVLDALAERFGATGAHLWELMIRAKIIEGWLNLLGAVACAVVIYGCRRFYLRHTTKHAEDPYYDATVFAFPLGIVSAIAAIVGTVAFFCGLFLLLNPEYAAIRSLVPGQ